MTTKRGESNVFSFVAWINGLSSAIVTSRSRAVDSNCFAVTIVSDVLNR